MTSIAMKGRATISQSDVKQQQVIELHTVMVRFAQLLKTQMKEVQLPFNLASGQIYVLFMLYDEPTCKVTDIVNALGVTSGAATGLTDKLVALELIERHRPEDDRRVVRLSLTSKGKETVEQIRKQRIEWFSELIGQLDDDNVNNMVTAFHQLVNLLEKK